MDSRMREAIRQRADRRCEYCRLPEAAVPYLVFHVDHIIAKQHLDEISEDLEMLCWACSRCNYHKGPNLASIDPVSNQQVKLFHPRSDNWDEHFRLADGKIVGLSPQGRATARLLAMNSSKLIRLRLALVELGEM